MDTKQPEALRLAPCPFCGGGARRTTVGTNAWFGTGCDGDQSCPAHLRALTHKTQAEADAAWNRRTPPAAAEMRRLHAENEALSNKLQTFEALGGAVDDLQLLRMGYAAARLEIESLKKAMAQEDDRIDPDHEALLAAAQAYIVASNRMDAAMQDGLNVQGAMSGIIGATDNLHAAIAAQWGV